MGFGGLMKSGLEEAQPQLQKSWVKQATRGNRKEKQYLGFLLDEGGTGNVVFFFFPLLLFSLAQRNKKI